MSKTSPNIDNETSGPKSYSDRTFKQIIPQIPKIPNIFSRSNDYDGSIFSNSESNSKSFKSRPGSKYVKSHTNTSSNSGRQNNIERKIISEQIVKRIPSHFKASSNKQIGKSVIQSDEIAPKSNENYLTSVYFSHNNIPVRDSPISNENKFLSLKSNVENCRENNLLKRNMIFYNTNEKKKRDIVGTITFSMKNSQKAKKDKMFTNIQNQILNDLTFYEEGLVVSPKIIGNLFRLKEIELFYGILGRIHSFCKACDKTKLSMLFNSFILLLIYMCYIAVFYEFAYNKETDVFLYFYVFTGFCLLIISLVRLFKNKSKIISHFFGLDILSLVFFMIFLINIQTNFKIIFAIAFFICKVPWALEVIKNFDQKLCLKKNVKKIFAFLLIIVKLCSLAHLFSCLWIYLGYNYKENNSNWLMTSLSKEIYFTDLLLYIKCFSVFLSNFTLFGLNVTQNIIVPSNVLEYSILTISMLFSPLFYCCIFKSVNEILDKKSTKNNKKIKKCEKALKSYKINESDSKQLSTEMIIYLKKNNQQKILREFLDNMPFGVCENVLKKIYFPILEKIPVISKNFSQEVQKKICYKLQSLNLSKNEILFQDRDYENPCLYFILDGEIECFINLNQNQKKIIRTLYTNDYLGEFSFFSNCKEKFFAKTNSSTTLIKLDLIDFLDILKEFPEDLENYHAIKEKINTYENFSALYLKCEACKQSNHQITDCPCLAINYKKFFLEKNLISSSKNLARRIIFRKTRKVQINALCDSIKIESKALDFQNKNKETIEKIAEEFFYQSSDNENESFENLDFSNVKTRKSIENEIENIKSRDSVNLKIGEDLLMANPPSIFLQSPTKKSRRSLTESIFYENEEEDDDDDSEQENEFQKINSRVKNTLADFESSYNEENKEEQSEEIEKPASKITSVANSEKHLLTTSNLYMSSYNMSQSKLTRTNGPRSLSETESKMDTIDALQNLEKMKKEKKKIPNEKSSLFTNTHTFTRGKSFGVSTKSYNSMRGFTCYRRRKKGKNIRDMLSDELFYLDFDKQKEFKNFFPHNNASNVVQKVKIDKLLNDKKN